MSKRIDFDLEARDALKRGVDILANSVKVTLGPQGRNVTIARAFGLPQTTKDGVTVAKEIELEDPVENMGAQMVKSVAARTNDLAGDGTTTATVLAQAIVTQGLKNIAAGAKPNELRKGIDLASKHILANLEKLAIPVKTGEELVQIASVSANNDEKIGKMIGEAYEKVGNDGVITVEDSTTGETYVDLVEGMQFDQGMISPYFMTNPTRLSCEFEDALILIYNGRITTIKELKPLLESLASSGRPLLIIADEVSGDALKLLLFNRIEHGLRVCAVKPAGFGERRIQYLEDIAALTGGQVVSESKGNALTRVTENMIGEANKVIVDATSTTIVDGGGTPEAVEMRVSEIKAQITTAENDYEKTKLEERIAKLTNGIGVIYVGAASTIEAKEVKDRVEDAKNATKAAIQEGIVPGGGIALIQASTTKPKGETPDQQVGIDIVYRAIEAPLMQIAENADAEGAVVLSKVRESKNPLFGYDARTGDYVDNMVDAGIIDPRKVTRIALENAASVAGMILTTDCTIVENSKPDPTKSLPNF